MKRLFVQSLLFFLIVMPAFPTKGQTGPFAGAPSQYSVDVTTTRKSGTPFLIKMYVDGVKRRTEQETNNGELVVILRGDVKTMYTLIVARKLYRISSFEPKSIQSFDVSELAKEVGVTREKVGTETINGQVCDKYIYSSDTAKEQSSAKSDKTRRSSSGFVWISQSTHLPVKSETDTATTVWSNLQVGPQDPSLFNPPADYKPID